MSKRKRHDAVSTEIAASPEVVYDLVADITRMGEWSPECYQCTWSKGATGPAVARGAGPWADQGRADRRGWIVSPRASISTNWSIRRARVSARFADSRR